MEKKFTEREEEVLIKSDGKDDVAVHDGRHIISSSCIPLNMKYMNILI